MVWARGTAAGKVAGKDYVSATAAATQTFALDQARDWRYTLPWCGASEFEARGPDTEASGVGDGREVRDAAFAVMLNNANQFEVRKAAGASTALTDYYPLNYLTCEDFPNGPNSFIVHYYRIFTFSGTGNRTSTTFTDIPVSGQAITNPSHCMPWRCGAFVDGQGIAANSLSHRAIQDATGNIVSAKMGGDHNNDGTAIYALVEFQNPIGRWVGTGAELEALIAAQGTDWVAGETLAAHDIRHFYDPRDISTGLAAGNQGEADLRLVSKWRRRFAGTAPNVAWDAVPAAELDNWEWIGWAASTEGTPKPATAAHLQLVQGIEANTGAAYAPPGDSTGPIFVEYVTRGGDSSPGDRPKQYRRPPVRPSARAGYVNLVGNVPNGSPLGQSYYAETGPGNTADDQSELAIYMLPTFGLRTIRPEPYWVGVRAEENLGAAQAAALNMDNTKGVQYVDLSDSDLTAPSSYAAQIMLSHSNGSRGGNEDAGAKQTHVYLDQTNPNQLGIEQLFNNSNRSLLRVVSVYDFSDMEQGGASVEVLSVTGDRTAGTIRIRAAGFAGVVNQATTAAGNTLTYAGSPAADEYEFSYVWADWNGQLQQTPINLNVVWTFSDGTDSAQATFAITDTDPERVGVLHAEAFSGVPKLLTTITGLGAAGDTYMSIGDAKVTNRTRVYEATAGGTVTYTVYTGGQWSVFHVEPLEAPVAAPDYLTGDSTLNTDPAAGAFTWPAPWVELDGQGWTSDGACVRPNTLNAFTRVHNTTILSQDTISAEVMHGQADDNDTLAPWLHLGQTDYRGYYADVVTTGTGDPDRIEFRRVDSADGTVIANLDFASVAVLGPDSRVRLQYAKSSGTLSLFVDDVFVQAVIDTTYGNVQHGGLWAQPRNLNAACVKAVAVTGQAGQRIETLNGSSNIPVLVHGQPLTIEWTETGNGFGPYTLTDDRGLSVSHPATATGGSQDTITLDVANLHKGPIVVTALNGESAQAFYPAPTGFRDVNLDAPVHLTGTTAGGWLAGRQLTYPNQTDQGFDLLIDQHGVVNIAGGDLWQSADIAVHDGTNYLAPIKQYFFAEIASTAVPEQVVGVGGTLDVDLAAYWNPTITLPQTESGTVGTLTITAPVSPAGAAIVGTRLQGTLTDPTGRYSTTVTVTDPDGAVSSQTFDVVINDAPSITPVPDQDLINGNAISLDLSTFVSDQDAVTIAAALLDSNPLSSVGLSLTGTTITGTPLDDAMLTIRWTATDTFGIQSVDIFQANWSAAPNVAPSLDNPIGALTHQAGTPWTFTFPNNTFSDAQPLNYSAALNGGGAIATEGITLTGQTFGHPDPEVKLVAIDLVASDGTLTTTDTFTIDFQLGAPNIINALPNPLSLTEGQAMTPIDLSTLFNGLPTSYNATGLPPGITLSGTFLQGTPTATGTYNIGVTATNAAGTSAPINTTAEVAVAPAPTSDGTYFKAIFR